MKRLFVLFVFFILEIQVGWTQSIDSIARYSKMLVRDSLLENREYAFSFLNERLGTVLQDSFVDLAKEFPPLEGLSVLEDSSRTMRIVTYQLYSDTSDYKYGGWIQVSGLPGPVFLEDHSGIWEVDPDLDYTEFSPGEWYGALYYQILPVHTAEDKSLYALFGFDNYHFYTKRKILDFLVVEEGRVRFGAPLIQMEEGLPEEYRRSRYILDYAVQAPATLRYDTREKMVIFDHLIFMKSNYAGQKLMRVPDGTYSGFSINEEGVFSFVEKLYHETLDEAPGGRKNENSGRDPILGSSADWNKRGTKKRDKN